MNARLDTKRGALAAWGSIWSGIGSHGAIHGKEAEVLKMFVDREPFIDHRSIDKKLYFTELAKYRFLIAPRGNGIQSPKFMEALLVLTIPITLRYPAFTDLKKYGFPYVLVDSWDDITPENLDKWW